MSTTVWLLAESDPPSLLIGWFYVLCGVVTISAIALLVGIPWLFWKAGRIREADALRSYGKEHGRGSQN
jgi:hypothetical protein